MTGSFVISLDFELMWGVRDHRSVKNYGDAVLGGRRAIPEILSKFKDADIRATWATVGLLFAKSRDEMLEYSPVCRPRYINTTLSPYTAIEEGLIGNNEADDPFHFGASLISQINATPGQEISTHTFSHYYCMESGACLASFDADLESAIRIAANSGVEIGSAVFPRNQASKEFIGHLNKRGITVYRGDANGCLYQSRSGKETNTLFRLARFIDGALPLGAKQVVYPSRHHSVLNVPASRFLRPWSKKMMPYQALHIRRVKAEMSLAARTGGCYHLWMHPHNFGRNLEQNLAQLDEIIIHFKRCRDDFGMVSKNMFDFTNG